MSLFLIAAILGLEVAMNSTSANTFQINKSPWSLQGMCSNFYPFLDLISVYRVTKKVKKPLMQKLSKCLVLNQVFSFALLKGICNQIKSESVFKSTPTEANYAVL